MTYLTTADDFGLHSQATAAILDLVNQHKLKQVSVLVNMPDSAAALKLCQNYPKVKWGIHLNIIEGKPISLREEIPTLVNHQGNFYSLPRLLLRTLFHQVNFIEVELEFSRQLQKLMQYTQVVHLNSHQNLHLFGPYWEIAVKLAEANHISHIRQASSVKRRLRHFPHKYVVFIILWYLFWHNHSPQSSDFEETLIHPGTTYD